MCCGFFPPASPLRYKDRRNINLKFRNRLIRMSFLGPKRGEAFVLLVAALIILIKFANVIIICFRSKLNRRRRRTREAEKPMHPRENSFFRKGETRIKISPAEGNTEETLISLSRSDLWSPSGEIMNCDKLECI